MKDRMLVSPRKRDPENRSEKYCVCGGHNANNPKSNKHHHSTRSRLAHRRSRQPVDLSAQE